MSNHLKPKEEPSYRTEFPGNYYSSSSVYSYSPTSTSDCPEHGRSRRRTTLILVTSVVLATLGVLSIAGIAAYLGIISKSISNNASHFEESYLQSDTDSRGRSSEEDDITYNHGRSRHNGINDHGIIDLTNALADTKTGIEPNEEETLINPHIIGIGRLDHETPPEIITGGKMNRTHIGNPIKIAPRPVAVIVTSSSTSTSASHDRNDNHITSNNNNLFNPVDMIPPPTRGIENSVSYFTEESTSVKSYTKQPPRYNRNRNRHPMTNSHSLYPSTTTQINRNSEEDQLSNKNVSDSDREVETTEQSPGSGIKSSNIGSMNRETQTIVHVKPSDAKPIGPLVKSNNERAGSINSNSGSSNNHKSNQENSQNVFEERKGLADGPELHRGNNNKNNNNQANEDDPQKTTHPHNHHQSHFNVEDHQTSPVVISAHKEFANPSKDRAPLLTEESTPDYYMPITPIISSERDYDTSPLLSNHKMHLTFDSISPEYYDKKPWTPLLNRPNLDKRPRVDVTNGHSNPETTTNEPIIVWNTEEINNSNGGSLSPSPSPRPPPQSYYDYSHSAQDSANRFNNNGGVKDIDNGPISHGVTAHNSSIRRNHDQIPSLVVNSYKPIPSESSSEETTGGFRPVLIPAYTVIIPHIPNPKPVGNLASQSKRNISLTVANVPDRTNQVGHEPLKIPEDSLNMSFKTDRMGEVGDTSDEKLGDDDDDDRVKDVKEKDSKKQNSEESDEKTKAEDIKEEDYGDGEVDELTGDTSPQTNIYKLDLDNVDVVPDTLGFQNPTPTDGSNTASEYMSSSVSKPPSKESVDSKVIVADPDPFMKTTTDLIMSTLGSLNLIKSSSYRSTDIDTNYRSNVDPSISSEESESSEIKTEAPLFPPVRSYVAVNLPLRPKPSAHSEGPMKQLRLSDEVGGVPMLRPDLTTSSSLQKVLSMMMKFEGDESRNMKGEATPLVNVTKQNVNLFIANVNGSLVLTSSPDPTIHTRLTGNHSLVSTTTSNATASTHREQKSYANRDSKIDEQFAPASTIEHVPVPLIVTERPKTLDEAIKMKLSSVKVNDKNSPVYKFILKKGQSVEELLKEIFQQYKDVEADEARTNPSISFDTYSSPSETETPKESSSNQKPSTKSLNDYSVEETTQEMASTTIRVKHHVETMPIRVPLFPSTSDPPLPQTVTSIVISEDDREHDDGCPVNGTFRCVSTGKCIPSYLRCNFIKECPDNSDEENCSCADFLKANGNGRKLCDGVVDCADASDEYAYCEYCQPGQYICAGSRTCINRTQICDSKRDCQNGDDENECVKIGRNDETNEVGGEFSSTYHKNGQLMVRKKGVWGKLCVETFSSVVSHWEVKDLARAVCKALTFSDFESVQRVEDNSVNTTEPYYELFYGAGTVNNGSESSESDNASAESTPRVGLGFKKTECKSKLVVNVTCQDLQCGTAPRSFTQTARIVGGANSMPGKWPWQAALYKNGEYQCGATLISNRWLLSAGHCFYHAQDDYWVARLGTLRRGATVLSPYEQVVRITHIFLHPQYKDVGFVNDVSLLRLEKEVNFTDYVRPVCLPGKDTRIRDGRMCTVVGWGQLFEVGRVFPDTLQEVQLPLISTSECRKRTLFLPLYKLTDQMFCAGFDRGGRDACLGDSGGPLMCLENDGRWSLYGVTSNGYGCARANRPGVYTKVASYLDWIYEKMSQDSSFIYRDKSKQCSGHRCLLGECLDRRQVCNGIRDCIEDNGSDERGPNCTYSGQNT